ncbi:MAG: ABC transporter substrate-binding protein [Ignavibacteriae bacterium]|nr:MAG: ABC transporter substrate-binding protein [Ignavibacteriota bacterium]
MLNQAKNIFLLMGLMLLIPLAPCRPQENGLKKITILPSWVPQAQFAGYYMAKEKKIFEKYGLDVEILPGGYTHDVITALQNGQVDFGITFLYTGVIERAKGTKLLNIGQVLQHSGIMFVAKKKSGIHSLADFNGKRIGIWRSVATELTTGFLKKHNIHAEIIPFNNAINVFLKSAVDITVMMNYNEYKRLIDSGVDPDEITVFPFRDYGMRFPGDGLYCMETTFKKDPDMCKKFVRASLEGWTYAFAHAEETLEVINSIKEHANVPSNRSHSGWMLDRMQEMVHSPDKNVPLGFLSKSDYDHLVSFLYENKFIANKPLYIDFYKDIR